MPEQLEVTDQIQQSSQEAETAVQHHSVIELAQGVPRAAAHTIMKHVVHGQRPEVAPIPPLDRVQALIRGGIRRYTGSNN